MFEQLSGESRQRRVEPMVYATGVSSLPILYRQPGRRWHGAAGPTVTLLRLCASDLDCQFANRRGADAVKADNNLGRLPVIARWTPVPEALKPSGVIKAAYWCLDFCNR